MNFTGQLRSNEIFGALYNLIISQEVFADNIKGSDLVDKARVDGSLYGDTKLYYSTDALKSSAWGNDAEATNLLQLFRPEAPDCQAIVIDVFRQIPLTTDQYLSKRAWGDEGAFMNFTAVMKGWLSDTKKVYEGTTYNAFIGTMEGASANATIEVALSDITATGEEKNRLEAEMIAEAVANTITEMKDYTRDFNDYGHLRRYAEEDIKIIWNAKKVNKIKKIDLPSIFHNEGLIDKFAEEVLPAKYFGEVCTTNVTSAQKVSGKKYRALVEQLIGDNHYFPGDELKAADTAFANKAYVEDEDVICKIITKYPPYMSGFSVSTSFFNPKSLTETNYVTFGHNTLEYLKGYPLTTLHAD